MALASLAQMNKGKNEILENDFFEVIIGLLDDKSEKVQLNIIELIGSIAEHPKGRKMAEKCLEKLEELKKTTFLEHYINETVDVITWKP